MVAADPRERFPVLLRDQFDVVRSCMEEIRGHLATMNAAMDTIEHQQQNRTSNDAD